MPICYEKRITRDMLRRSRDVLFVFGDNLQRRGMGGQAAEMRGEPNAMGIPTKKAPHMGESAFFTNKDADVSAYKAEAFGAFDALAESLERGVTVVLPEDGLGTGRAELERRSPRIWRLLQEDLARLRSIADGTPDPTPPASSTEGEAG